MIGYVKGVVTALEREFCFLETGGIGYRIFISEKDAESLHVGEETKLRTYLAVREDALLLYGFLTKEAYELFLVLISVSKIGPKVAMGILSSLSPQAFSRAVVSKDMAVLTRLPGIGKKTAERVIVELKDKIGGVIDDDEIPTVGGPFTEETGIAAEAAMALQALNYTPAEYTKVLQTLAPKYTTSAALIRAALQALGKGR